MDQPADIPFEDTLSDPPSLSEIAESVSAEEHLSREDLPEQPRFVEALAVQEEEEADASVLEDSLQFITNWNRLVSMTNWEKGKIISDWRAAMQESGAPVQTYSDEAWSKMVGNVSGQHVGRLRRVYDRFGDSNENYPSLFWSHFQAALDWDDAEMWLEGGVANRWSVSQMRAQRWEAMGAPADKKPKEADIVMSEMDEDVDPRDDSSVTPQASVVQDEDGADFDPNAAADGGLPGDGIDFGDDAPTSGDLNDTFRAFTGFPAMPIDLEEAFETVKIAILNHKLTEWRDVKPETVLEAADALKALVLGESK